MCFLYILQSESSGRFYFGSTDDLDRRLAEHHCGHTPSTRGRGPWRLVYTEALETLIQARGRELGIKKWKSARMMQALIRTLSAQIAHTIGTLCRSGKHGDLKSA